VAVGVTGDGKRRVLGVSVALSEAEVHWRAFLDSLIRRGLKGVRLIVSDDHAGLKAARRATLPSVPWQHCQFHLQQNAQAYVTRLDQRKPVALRIRAIFNAPDKTEAERLLRQALEAWQTEAPKLALWAEENLPEGFAVFDLPHTQRAQAPIVVPVWFRLGQLRCEQGDGATHFRRCLPAGRSSFRNVASAPCGSPGNRVGRFSQAIGSR